jgi:DtxR family Mn-dependent transcriptional regulator
MTLPASSVAQDYLKAVYGAGEWTGAGTTTSALAARLGVSPSTASETVRRLAAAGLVEHERYGLVSLTETGRAAALAVVRRHRIVETYLVERLGYSWDEVHEEAELLEHALSERLLARMDAALGHPERDPHGDPIPQPDGTVPQPPAVPLATLTGGARGRVARISDAEPQVLRYLTELGIGLDDELAVVEPRAFAGTTAIEVVPGEEVATGAGAGAVVDLGERAVAAIWVVPLEASPDHPPR